MANAVRYIATKAQNIASPASKMYKGFKLQFNDPTHRQVEAWQLMERFVDTGGFKDAEEALNVTGIDAMSARSVHFSIASTITRLGADEYECRTNVHPKAADPKPYRPPDGPKAGESSPSTQGGKAVDEPKAEEPVNDKPDKTGSRPKADTWSDRVTVFLSKLGKVVGSGHLFKDGSREFLNVDPQKPVLKGMYAYWRLNTWTTLENYWLMCVCSDDGRYQHNEHPSRIFEIIRGLNTLVSSHGETGFHSCVYYLSFGVSFPVSVYTALASAIWTAYSRSDRVLFGSLSSVSLLRVRE